MKWAHVGNRKDSIDCNSGVLPGMPTIHAWQMLCMY